MEGVVSIELGLGLCTGDVVLLVDGAGAAGAGVGEIDDGIAAGVFLVVDAGDATPCIIAVEGGGGA